MPFIRYKDSEIKPREIKGLAGYLNDDRKCGRARH